MSWSSRKQDVVARSSTEAEYRVVAFATAEVAWLENLLFELGVPCSKPPVLLCDNQSALNMCANPVFHNRSKHIEINYHFVREKVEQGLLIVRYVPTQDQFADIFTKALGSSLFIHFRDKLNVRTLPLSLTGDIKDKQL